MIGGLLYYSSKSKTELMIYGETNILFKTGKIAILAFVISFIASWKISYPLNLNNYEGTFKKQKRLKKLKCDIKIKSKKDDLINKHKNKRWSFIEGKNDLMEYDDYCEK